MPNFTDTPTVVAYDPAGDLVESMTWTDPTGEVFSLMVEWDVEGRFAPPARVATRQTPGQAGVRFHGAGHGARRVLCAMWWEAESTEALRVLTRRLVLAMDPTRGLGTLRNVAPDGAVRELYCVAEDGLGLAERYGETSGLTWQRAVVTFLAPDPYWYDPTPVTRTWVTSNSGEVPFFPGPPFTLSAPPNLGPQQVTNDGDVEAWPIWTFRAPFTGVTVANGSTGKLLVSTLAKTTGFQIVDTRRTSPRAYDDTGASRLQEVASDPASSLFPLRRGVNALTFDIAGVPLGESAQVELVFYRRFLSP